MMQRAKNRFLWGVATSAFQIEGGIANDMTDWEAEGRFRRGNFDPKVGLAVDHWNRWREDFDLLSELKVNSYRFSMEWARLEPRPGRYDDEALRQYLDMLDDLQRRDIEPMVTLHHFTHPSWFHERSPWHSPRSVESFVRFVEYVAPHLKGRTNLIVTLNEPLVWLLAGYGDAKFPPGLKDYRQLMEGLYHMLIAHGEAYDIIKGYQPSAQVGIAHNFINFKRAPHGFAMDRRIKRLIHYFYNRMIIKAFENDRLKLEFPFLISFDRSLSLDGKIDFWGVNYYYRLHVRFRLNFKKPFDLFFARRSSGEGQSDLGWEIYPKGLKKVFRWLKDTDLPIYVTENGVAAADDTIREQFLESHLEVVEAARAEGYDIRGYYHWSFLDNYEWLEGTRARFGLYGVDYAKNLGRKLKPSGQAYRDYIIAQKGGSSS